MDGIVANLKDPAWWFSAFFIAIVASIIAGFLKDKVERYLGSASVHFKEKRASSIAARHAVLEALVEHPTYLTLAFHRAAVRMLLYLMAMLMFLSSPLLLEITPPSDNMIMWLGHKDLARKFLSPLLGGFSIVVGFRATSSLSIALDGLKKYREKHGLPKLP